MIFSKFAILVVSPLGAALLLGLAALVLGWRRSKRWSWVLGCAGVGWLWLWSTPMASMWLRGTIEQEFPPVPVVTLAEAGAIVILGGAMNPTMGSRPFPDLAAGADRVWHGYRLYRAGKAPVLLLSGGSDPHDSSSTEAEAMRQLLHDFGVPDTALVMEGGSRNTRENARFSARLLRERGAETMLLVTSALHMRRALVHFREQGLEVIPAATDHETRPVYGALAYLPDTAALDGSTRALKEWVGQWIW